MCYYCIMQNPFDIVLDVDGQPVKVKDLPLSDQINYLISNHFAFFISKENCLWRLENLYYIQDKNGKKVLFKLNPAQRHFIDNYILVNNPYLRLIILKSRQLGFTSLISIFFLDQIIWKPNSNALQVAHTLKDAKELFDRKIRYTMEHLDKNVLSVLKINNKTQNKIQFIYDGVGVSSLIVSNSGRSGTYRFVHISEFAKLSKIYPTRADEVITGTIPSVPMDGTIIIESTAEGMNSKFYEMFSSAWKRKDIITPAMTKAEFYPVFYNWTWDKEEIEKACADGIIPIALMEQSEIDWAEYQKEHNLSDKEMTYYYLKWRQLERNVEQLHQEIPTTSIEAFIGSGSNWFSLKKIAECMQKYEDFKYDRYTIYDGKLSQSDTGDIYIKKKPVAGRRYVMGGDVAQGFSNGDYSTFVILDGNKEIQCYYRGHCEPNEFQKIIRVVAEYYNIALVAIERNADGNWVNTSLVETGYPNIYLRSSFDDITKTVTQSYGWLTDSTSRKNIMTNAKAWFSLPDSEVDAKHLLDEMMTFITDKKQRPVAANGKHDDVIISWAIALYVSRGISSIKETENDVNKNIIDYFYV